MARKPIAVVPSALVKPLMAWFKGTQARRRLADMPAYLLRDIGLRRDQIAGLADEVGTGPARPAAAAAVIDMNEARDRIKPARPEKPMAA